MKVVGTVLGVLVGAFVLLAAGFTFGAAVFFAAADDMARRREARAEERTS